MSTLLTPRRTLGFDPFLTSRRPHLRGGNDARHHVGAWLPTTLALGALAACSSPATPSDASTHDSATVVDCGSSTCTGQRDVTGTDATGTDVIGTDATGTDVTGTDATGTDAGVDVATPVDATVGTDAATDVPTVGSDVPSDGALAVLPALDSATIANVRSILATGVTMGNRPNVFAKIGDSISESGSFLQDLGHGWFDLGSYTSLMGTVTYFNAVTFSGGTNSFDRPSVCAVGGWTSADALAGGDSSPFMNELRAIQPAWAVIMYGTNDVDHWGVDVLTTNLTEMITRAEGLGVVPILSTIPDRQDAPGKDAIVLTFNSAIRALAQSRHVPYMDYWYALQPLPSQGISSDGIHPNAYTGPDSMIDTCYFTTDALQYGYNMRNLVVVQTLDEMRTTFEP